MRVVCPCVLAVTIVLVALAWFVERYDLAVINAFLAGVNSMLTWINWRVFSI